MPPAKQLPHLSAKERALIKAIQAKDKESVRDLTAKGVNVNCEGGWEHHTGVTPLMFASESGSIEIVRALLKAGANPNSRDRSLDVNRQERPDATAIHYAVQLYTDNKPSLKVIKALLDAGANPNDRYAIGDTALDIVSGRGFLGATELLLEHGGDPNATFGRQGRNALSEAAGNGHVEIVQRLLVAGADPNGSDDGGGTALMSAATCPGANERRSSGKVYLEIIRLLLRAGARIDATTAKGQTALMVAVDEAACSLDKVSFGERFAAVQLLIKEGKAQINLKDSQKRTALDYASVSDFPELSEYLRKRGGKLGSEI
jgi:hypothetical protein